MRQDNSFGPPAPGTSAVTVGPRPNVLSVRRARLLNPESEFILTMVLHPALFGEFEEMFAALPEGSDENTELRRVMFNILSAEPEIGRDALIARLAAQGSWMVLMSLLGHEMLHAELRELCATLFDGKARAASSTDSAATNGADTATSRKSELLQAIYRDNREIMELGRVAPLQ